MAILISFIAGLTFGLGLIISGMGNPAKVIAFLDLAGSWDPSLALVMAGAILVGLVSFTIAKKRETSLLGYQMQLPTNKQLDKKLVIGSAVFGMGWGLAGICPGPALLLLGAGYMKGIVFFLALLFGMFIFDYQTSRTK